MKWRDCLTVGTDGGCRSGGVTVVERPVGKGYACYVTAHRDGGMDGQQGILLRPEWEDTADYVAIENHSSYWCRPFWGKSLADLPERVQLLLIRRGERYVCILPLCGDTFKTVLRGGEQGPEFCVYSNLDGMTDCADQPVFLCVEGDSPLNSVRDCAALAGQALGHPVKLRKERKVSPIFDFFGWCSWDAFQIWVSHAGLLEKAAEFREKSVPVRYGIIDDMWGNCPNLRTVIPDDSFPEMVKKMHASSLYDFEGDPERFPQGMAGAIADLKKAGMDYVGVWFPTTGYWNGIDPDSPAAEEYKGCLTEVDNGQQIVHPEHAGKYFDLQCGKVKNWGADFVKIDNQGYHKRYRNYFSIGKSSAPVQQAIDEAAKKHFDGALINCMGMPSECMFHRPDSAVSRCSDDFMPESREWFAKNILQCSYNGLLQGQFYVNDWDMWWTDDEQAVKNSLCRAVSGGPIYVSDKVGRTRPEVLKPLMTADGRIFRCDESATPTADCLFENPTESGKIFKIRNRAGKNGIVALFNIDAAHRSVSGTVCPEETGVSAGEYIYYEFFTGAWGRLKSGESVCVTLETNDDFRLYTFLPADEITVIGRTDLMIGCKAVTRSGNTVTLAEGGPVAFVSGRPVKVLVNGRERAVTDQDGWKTVTLQQGETEFQFV